MTRRPCLLSACRVLNNVCVPASLAVVGTMQQQIRQLGRISRPPASHQKKQQKKPQGRHSFIKHKHKIQCLILCLVVGASEAERTP